MSELRHISHSLPELSEAHPLSEELTLARTSGLRLSDDSVAALAMLMAETQARYPNQELPEGTPDMYLAEWERMAARYGLREFREGLLLVLQDRERPRFFPDPLEIEDRIRAILRAKSDRQRALTAMRNINEAKTIWMLERAEDLANGIERAPLPELAHVRARSAEKRHTAEEIAAYVAKHTTPEERESLRQRMNALINPAA